MLAPNALCMMACFALVIGTRPRNEWLSGCAIAALLALLALALQPSAAGEGGGALVRLLWLVLALWSSGCAAEAFRDAKGALARGRA